VTPEGWQTLVDTAKQANEEIAQHAQASATSRGRIDALSAEVDLAATESTNRIKTQTGQLFTLIQAATNRQAEAVFEEEATELKKEERGLWRIGIAIVSAASVIAVLPLIIHYFGGGPRYTGSGLLAAHFTAAGSFAVVSGVLFARARGRDRTRQRARDLTLALSTMFAYSGQIHDETERARFVYEMGRVVIESFLRADAPTADESPNNMAAAMLAR
jgi:hypothetical protein